ncbi:MAG: hypothetical protein U1E83_03155 [Methylotetracoccus sp.]
MTRSLMGYLRVLAAHPGGRAVCSASGSNRRRRTIRKRQCCLLVAGMCTASWLYGADEPHHHGLPGPDIIDQQAARGLRQAGLIVPLASLTERALSQRPGRLLDVRLIRPTADEPGGYIYELQLLGEDGTVSSVRYRAESGTLIVDEGD